MIRGEAACIKLAARRERRRKYRQHAGSVGSSRKETKVPKVAVIVKTQTQPGKRDEVRRLWEVHLRPRVEANAAQEVYFFCEDTQDPDTFYLFEIYSDPDALSANAGSEWFAEYLQAVRPLLADRGEVGVATPVWVKGVQM
jgi:quinol monooxygenase YgiN